MSQCGIVLNRINNKDNVIRFTYINIGLIVNKKIVFQALEIKSMNIENPQSHIFSSNIKVQGSIIRTMSKETWNGHAGYGLESEREKRKKKSYS